MESPITLSIFEGFSQTMLMKFELVAFCGRCPSSKVIGDGSDHE
jgi:hypothetical protein